MQLHNKYIQWWLWSGAGLIFLMLVIGGITRLAGAGLSMSDWNLLMGALPPMSESEWTAAFERYQQFPEYQQLNTDMTLEGFKEIFFWEYLHRLTGRITGIVFLIPFLFFWIRGYFSQRMFKRALFLFGLGALQGAAGWIMVKSGLSDVPYVSHYRLALHLLLAFLLVSFCIWFALDLRDNNTKSTSRQQNKLHKWASMVGILFVIQLIWGAFTAGLEAGTIYNTFPLMNGEWLPQNAWAIQPVLLNLIENPGMVQWTHRIIGSILSGLVIWLWIRSRTSDISRTLKLKADLMLGFMLLQYGLGILTLLYDIPITLGVLHQAMAMIVWTSWLIYYHELANTDVKLNLYFFKI